MASDHGRGPPDEYSRTDYYDRPSTDQGYATDRTRSNGGRRTPDSGYRLKPTGSAGSGMSIPHPGVRGDDEPRKSGERNRSRQRSGRTASGQLRICKKCGEPLTGQFVRALDGTFHLDCFKCRDCGQIVASKFFPADDEDGSGQYPLCETDYFRRLGLLCHQCGGALRGSYITALDRKYHVDHFTCSLCPTIFGAQDSYYEHDGNVYCHYHYSTQFAQKCNGCQTAILKQFVEIFRNGQNQHWHPECYMIHKFWNVRLMQPQDAPELPAEEDDPTVRARIREDEERMEEKVFRIWSVLSTFEESSAACISDMLLHVSNGAYVDGVLVAKRFIWHVEIIFQSADKLDAMMAQVCEKTLSYSREAKLLCKKIVAFLSSLSKTQDAGVGKVGVTQELLSLVTGLAHYLKLLIRICLQGALRLEREAKVPDGLYHFLDGLDSFESFKAEESGAPVSSLARLSKTDSDQCAQCSRSVEEECAKSGDLSFHLNCVKCSRCGQELGRSLDRALYMISDRRIFCTTCISPNYEGLRSIERVTRLQQYIFLLKVAMARLLDILRNNGTLPYTNDSSTLNGSGNSESRKGSLDPPRLQTDARSKSYNVGSSDRDHRRESSYENTLNDVKRLRSTRLDRHLSSSVRQARTSKVMDADGKGPRPGSPGLETSHEGSTDAMFGQNDAITLDDIPRIVAVEQSREQQQSRDLMIRQDLHRSPATEPSMSHQRTQSAGRDQDVRAGDMMPTRIHRRFFSELSGLEYFNVRHLAVLTMQPMIEQEFSLDELLTFIESRKQPTFWKNLGKAFKNDKSKNVKKKGVFGVPLEAIIERDGAESTDGVGPGALRIPAVIDDIVSSMRQMDLSVEGVFRKNGNIKKQQELVDKINAEGCDMVNFMEQPVVQLAALLKRYLRDLPDPLMTLKLYRLWISAAKIDDPERRKQCLHLTCCLLPKSHRDSLEILFYFLKWAGSFHQLDEESGSKMDIRNLATVIAPNILTNTSKAAALDSEAIYVIDAVEMLIVNIEEMCQVPDEILALLSDPFLFANNGETTTKDLLKRFQDRRGQVSITDANEVFNRPDNPIRPPPRRVETDPTLWQGETTVRTIHELPAPFAHPDRSTPPGGWKNPDEQPSPYRNHYNHSHNHNPDGANEGNSSNAQRRDWRNSGWGRQGSGLGVGGQT